MRWQTEGKSTRISPFLKKISEFEGCENLCQVVHMLQPQTQGLCQVLLVNSPSHQKQCLAETRELTGDLQNARPRGEAAPSLSGMTRCQTAQSRGLACTSQQRHRRTSILRVASRLCDVHFKCDPRLSVVTGTDMFTIETSAEARR